MRWMLQWWNSTSSVLEYYFEFQDLYWILKVQISYYRYMAHKSMRNPLYFLNNGTKWPTLLKDNCIYKTFSMHQVGAAPYSPASIPIPGRDVFEDHHIQVAKEHKRWWIHPGFGMDPWTVIPILKRELLDNPKQRYQLAHKIDLGPTESNF